MSESHVNLQEGGGFSLEKVNLELKNTEKNLKIISDFGWVDTEQMMKVEGKI